jgi:hypothetical protein
MSQTEPEPDSLDERVDWMTYPHDELYRMVHEGLDLAGATAVSADWARMGEALGEIGDELAGIVAAFADAWEGEAAEQARHAVSSLATWARETGASATAVSGCITIEVDNAMHARNTMPAPVPVPPPPFPPRGPIPAGDATVASSAFSGGEALLADQSAIVGRRVEAHREAAAIMERFQADSREVYRTVPQFAPPRIGPKPLGGEDNPPAPSPPPSSAGESVPAERVRSGGRVPVAGPPPASASPAPAAPPRQPGPGVGAVPGEGSAPSRSAVAGAQGRPGAAGMAGMPVGGLGGMQRQEDLERLSPAYLKEDEDIWGLDEQAVAPPVIGEERGRA